MSQARSVARSIAAVNLLNPRRPGQIQLQTGFPGEGGEPYSMIYLHEIPRVANQGRQIDAGLFSFFWPSKFSRSGSLRVLPTGTLFLPAARHPPLSD